MKTSEECYNRIMTDPSLDKNAFEIVYMDAIKQKYMNVSVTKWKPIKNGGDVPWHRVDYIHFNGKVVWDRKQRICILDQCTIADSSINELPQTFKVCTLNVMSDEHEKKITNIKLRIESIILFIKELNCDIICIQEVQPELLNRFKIEFSDKFIYATDIGYNEVVFITKVISTCSTIIPFSPSKQAIILNMTMYDGNTITFAGVHLTSDFRDSAESTRSKQLFKLRQHLNLANPVILLGDTNEVLPTLVHFDDFIDGWLSMHPNNFTPTYDPEHNKYAKVMSKKGTKNRYDRICYNSANSTIILQSIEVNTVVISDHYPVIAIFKLDDQYVGTSVKHSINVNTSSLCIIPPFELLDEVSDMRKRYDPNYDKWMTHINVFFPFVSLDVFDEFVANVENLNIEPFDITLDVISMLPHEKTTTLCLCSNKAATEGLTKLRTMLCKFYNAPAQYKPHLTLGNFSSDSNVMTNLSNKRMSISWTIDRLHLISRAETDTFVIKNIIKLPNYNPITYDRFVQLLYKFNSSIIIHLCGSRFFGIESSDYDILVNYTMDRTEFFTKLVHYLNRCGEFDECIVIKNDHVHCIKLHVYDRQGLTFLSIDLHYSNGMEPYENSSTSLLLEPTYIMNIMNNKQLFLDCLIWLRNQMKLHGIYGQAFCYIGGLSVAILTAFVIKTFNVTTFDEFVNALSLVDYDRTISLKGHIHTPKTRSDGILMITKSVPPYVNTVRNITPCTKELIVNKLKSGFNGINKPYDTSVTITINCDVKPELLKAVSLVTTNVPKLCAAIERRGHVKIIPSNKWIMSDTSAIYKIMINNDASIVQQLCDKLGEVVQKTYVNTYIQTFITNN
jgi:endonuclease/exonuclease/phosphatase family metal-dependent hydrolase/2'-5' RNA ligase/uncharacterized protein (UPF0248 family)